MKFEDGVIISKFSLNYLVAHQLVARNADDGMSNPVDFSAFKTTYDALGDKLRPQVFELGFMR